MKCRQCGTEAESHPIIAIMDPRDGGEDFITTPGGKPVESFGSAFRAYPMCAKCHAAPTLKAHYHFREHMEIGIRLAGMSSLAVPAAGKTA